MKGERTSTETCSRKGTPEYYLLDPGFKEAACSVAAQMLDPEKCNDLRLPQRRRRFEALMALHCNPVSWDDLIADE